MFHNSSLATTSHMSHHSQHSLSSHNGTATANSHDTSLQPHKENVLNAKTPLGKNTTNNPSRRRALGDISNRKSGNEKLGGQQSTTKSSKSSSLSNYQTPHKSRSKKLLKQVLGPTTSVQKSSQHVPPVSTVKKKSVSFAIHTEPDEDIVKKDETKVNEDKWKLMNQSHARKRHDMYDDDIEVSAGRTALQEREFLGDKIYRVDSETERDIEEILRIGKAYTDYKDELERNSYINIALAEVDVGPNELKNDPLAQLEDIDDDVFQSYLMFDEYKSLDLDIGNDSDVDDGMNQLMACMDDISI